MNTTFYRPRMMLALFAAAVLAAGLMAMVGVKPAWASEVNFEPAQNYPVGPYPTYPTDLTAADFDGDGNAVDLAVAIQGTTADTLGNVPVFSNEGDGTFAAARNVTAGISPLSVTSADFDRDGNEDLAVANGSNVSISLSNGDDTFQAAKYFPVGGGAVQVTTGHFNDDGAVDFVDLAVASLGSDAVSVLLGNGDGTFRAAKNFEVGDSPVSVTSGDFDGDGKADLATADDPRNPASGNIADSVSVLLGNGDGTFKDARRFSFPVGPDNHTNPQQVVSADFDGDGKADLAVANHGGGDIGGDGCCNPGYVSVLLSNGDGTFSEGWYLGTAPGMWRPDSLATADFDQDGIADLAIAQETNPDRGVVAVSLGNGDGTFKEGKAFTADYYPTFVIAEDLNDDNYPDLAVANRENFEKTEDPSIKPPRKVSVLLNIPPPGATTSTSESSGTAGDPQPSFQRASSETDPGLAGSSAAAAGNTTRISVDASGAQLNTSASGSASISSDGRYVVFTSTSPDLVANDTNNRIDVFVRDLTTGTTRRISVDSSGNQGDDTSSAPFISADGRFVAFSSRATNLVSGDTNKVPGSSIGQDVFVRDRDTDADGIFDEPGFVSTERVNVSSSGTQANNTDGDTPRLSISADGRFVAFSSRATNLVANDTNGTYDVFVRDRTMGTTQRVSVSSSGSQGNHVSLASFISADGRYVAFTSRATNLVSGDTNGAEDVFVRDRTTGTTRRVSLDSSGNQVNGACNEFACERSSVVSISSSGRYVAFDSAAFNLVANDTNDLNDIFVRDRDTDDDRVFDEAGAASTERVSVSSSGAQANRGGLGPFISSDGRYVTFNSQSTDLVANDTNVSPDVFVRDRTLGTTLRVSVGSSGTQSHLGGGGSSISTDGRFAVFSSQALDLVAGDTNGFTDVFLRELGDAPPKPGDDIAPTSTATARTDSGAAYTSGTWTSEDVQVSLSAQDNAGGSGIKEITYSINGGAVQTYNPTNKVPVNTEGTTTISYFATDNAGNQETPAKTFTVKLDKTAPQVTPADVVNNVWRNSPLSEQFAATDGGSGLANSADATFTLTASAESASATQPTVASRTVSDVAGNSTTRKVSALIDKSAPTGNMTINGGDAFTNTSAVDLTPSATDSSAGSGMAQMRFSNDGTNYSQWVSYDATPMSWTLTSGDGTKTVHAQYKDNAGNVSASAQDTIKVDSAAPTTTASRSPAANATGWNNSNVTVTLNAADGEGSGIQGIRYSATGAQTIAGTTVAGGSATVNISTEGVTTISYFATDNAGNQETAGNTFAVKLDKTAPQVTPGDRVDNIWRNSPLSEQFTASDGGSGLANSADATFTLTASEQSADEDHPTVASRTVSDVAGNSTTRKVSALIDLSAPSSSATATDSAGNNYTSGTLTGNNVTVTLSAQDNAGGSGIKEITYSINGGANQTYNPTNKIPVNTEGTTIITYFATDKAGNPETPAKTFTVKLDRPPMVASFAPVGKKPTGTGWERGTNITATFSEEMDQSTITAQTVKLVNTATGRRVSNVMLSYSETTKTVTLDPYGPTSTTLLAKNTKYKVTVTTGAKDLAGVPLDQNQSVSGNQPKSWTFVTGSTP